MKIQDRLVRIAPSIEFSVAWSPCEVSRWDKAWGEQGDFMPFDADVYARAILRGKMVEGRASLGACWEVPGDFDSDIGGYLPQMLEEAACDLLGAVAKQGGDAVVSAQLLEALSFLKKEMKDRWEKQQKGKKG